MDLVADVLGNRGEYRQIFRRAVAAYKQAAEWCYRDGGFVLWSRRGTAMNEPITSRLNALASITPSEPSLSTGV